MLHAIVKRKKKFNSLATKECLYLITLTANLMVVNQWHVIQAEQPNGFIDEWHLKLLLENRCSGYIKRAGTEPYHTVARLLRADFCFSFPVLHIPSCSGIYTGPRGQRGSCGPSPAQRKRDPLSFLPASATLLQRALNFGGKAGTLLEPLCCSYLPSATGIKKYHKRQVARAATRGLNTGAGFLFFLFQVCLCRSTPAIGI